MGIFRVNSGDIGIGRLVTGKNKKNVLRQCRLFKNHLGVLIWDDVKSGNVYSRSEDEYKCYIDEFVELKSINPDIVYYKKSELKKLANEIDKLNYKNNNYEEGLENNPQAKEKAHSLIKSLKTK